MHVYLDYQSAKPVDPRVMDAMQRYFTEDFGNPSSLHAIGDAATTAVDEARATIARFIHARSDEIIFTSGATESNNLALIGFASRNSQKGDHVIISETEHISIHNLAKFLTKSGFSVAKVPVDSYGMVDLKKIEDRITEKTILVSIAVANNEIGTIQPIRKIADLCHNNGIVFHTDGVAAQGMLDLDVESLGIDMLSLSSNDLYGPRGVGALFVKKGIRITPQMIGGGQESGLRSGSENVPGIIGMAHAATVMEKEMPKETIRFKEYRDHIIETVLQHVPRSYLNGHPKARLVNNAHFRFDGIEGESLLLALKDRGISVSTGSACSSKTLEPSHTLIALGLLHEEAHGSLEITVGRFTKNEDIDIALQAIPEVVQRLRNLSPLYKEV
jgi:cysteine desulfurase